MQTPKANDLVEGGLINANKTLASLLDADVIFLRSPIQIGVDDHVREYIEHIKASSDIDKKRLCVMLETNGGYIETVERIYSVFRRHYEYVAFVVPSFAYSAGTVLVLSGDDIYMDYYSVLGPIDPQVEGDDGNYIPGIGYLVKFNELVSKINSDAAGTSSKAELAFLIKKFDPAKLFFIEQAKEHAIELLKAWLPKHKFKDWLITATSKTPVTQEMKINRANKIAEVLGEPERWHSHGRGIGIRELAADDINLLVKDFGDDVILNSAIRCYYDLTIDFFRKMGVENGIHGQQGIRSI